MRSIEQMLAEGDFDAIRQLVDKEEAEAKRRAEERAVQKKYLQEKEKEIAEARETAAVAMFDYLLTLGLEFDDSDGPEKIIEDLTTALKVNEKTLKNMWAFSFGLKRGLEGLENPKEKPKPAIKNKSVSIRLNDDEVLRKFLNDLTREI